MDTSQVITKSTAARMAGKTRNAINNAIKRGHIRPIPLACGEYHVVSLADVEAWIANPPPAHRPPGKRRPAKK